MGVAEEKQHAPIPVFSAQVSGPHLHSWPGQARGLGQRLLWVSDIPSPLL